MNDTHTATEISTVPSDPVMAAPDPAMFASLTGDESNILRAHLTSGWYKQSAVYPVLSEPWRETGVVLDDIHRAWDAAWRAGHPTAERHEPGPHGPEAGS